VASIVDLRVFWQQPGSITNVLNCHDCHVFESNKYLLLLFLLLLHDELHVFELLPHSYRCR